ncbi:protein NO VEIN domain-containing protein [Larkinella punicea]|uniref:DUF3883 domain-containing protein n=1 Tax=Larkinella punicea TaxID=2315727 RepID=A0A368JG14_9BACT|nr:DUF3883 domain-containing protein [Larkinella punicea]RCR66482.1 DUF3883 domain-containing protein [Larkinella punicea]
MNTFSTRDKAILIGLYLSKFDKDALKILGFESTKQAFNTLGYCIGVKPASIKNYRDEFDPYFPNSRKGWHKRHLRDYCKKLLDDFNQIDFSDLTAIIKSFTTKNNEIEQIVENINKKDYSESVAKRLITGAAAEEYFKIEYSTIPEFEHFNLNDTTKLACGFDFHLTLAANYYCVEVKGLNELSGSVSLTEKEFLVAQDIREKYCLFIVSNFRNKPFHQYFFDPINSGLLFKKTETKIIQTTYLTKI